MRALASIGLALGLCACQGPDREVARSSATAGPAIDQKKFEGLYRAGKAFEGSLSVGITYMKFGELLQSLATEIAIAKEVAKTPEELRLLNLYEDFLMTLRDSATLWKGNIENRESAETQLLATKYHVVGLRADRVQGVWAVAGKRLEAANRFYHADHAGSVKALREVHERLASLAGLEQAAADAVEEAARARRVQLERSAAAEREQERKEAAAAEVERTASIQKAMRELDDPFVVTRAVAARNLGDLGDPLPREVVCRLSKLLSDPEAGVRHAAGTALEHAPASMVQPCLDIVASTLTSNSAQTRAAAASVLKAAGSRAAEALPALRKAAEREQDVPLKQFLQAAISAVSGSR